MGDVEQKNYYFAYGSNIWMDQMKRRCPARTYVGVASLEGWKWIINTRGYANIVPSEGDLVYGTVYELDPQDELILDRFEGVPTAYTKHDYALHFKTGKDSVEGRPITALVYIDLLRHTEGPPKREYIDRMNKAFEDGVREGIPEWYVEKYVRPVIPIEGVDNGVAS